MADVEKDTGHLQNVSSSECRDQAARIISSPDFDATARERRFLSYVVEETLTGNAARIKAYSIAIEVFERDSSFDPQNDPIVRIEAGRLRRALERYYLTAGASDPLVITIPKGGYVPTFSLRPALAAADPVVDQIPPEAPAVQGAATPSRRFRAVAALLVVGLLILTVILTQAPDPFSRSATAVPERPAVLVKPLQDLDRTGISDAFATGLTQEIIGKLSHFRDMTVIDGGAERAEGGHAAPGYELMGSVTLSSDEFRLRIRLVDLGDGSVVWAENYDGDLAAVPMIQAQTDIADSVAAVLGQPHGVIFNTGTQNTDGHPAADWESYRCTLSFYAFRTTLEPAQIPQLQQCLQTTVERFPLYATGWALLALVEMEALRNRFPHDPATHAVQVERALSHARRAVALDPWNVRGLQAEMFGLFFDRKFEAGKRVGEQALALNPNDYDLQGEYGSRLAMSGDRKAGCPLIRRARERSPVPSAYYDPGLALCAYFDGDFAEAAAIIGNSPWKNHPLHLVVAAVTYAEAGDIQRLAQTRQQLQETAPELVANLPAEVAVRFGRPEDVEAVMRSLVKAGLVEAATD